MDNLGKIRKRSAADDDDACSVKNIASDGTYGTRTEESAGCSANSSNSKVLRREAEPENLQASTSSPLTLTDPPSGAGTRNPGGMCLQNQLILPKIVKLMSVNHLLNLREVCSTWNQAMVLPLREKHTPIRLHAAFAEAADDNSCDKTANTKKYTALLAKSKSKNLQLPLPFAKYDLDIEACPRTLDLFTKYGTFITSLSIGASYNSGRRDGNVQIDALRRIIFHKSLQSQLQKLELTVSVGNTGNSTGNRGRESRRPPRELSRHPLPALKKLAFTGFGTDEPVIWLLDDVIRCAHELESLSLCHLGPGNGRLPIVSSLRDFAPHLEKVKELELCEIGPADLRILTDLAYRGVKGLRPTKLSFAIVYRHGHGSGTGQEIVDRLHEFLVALSRTRTRALRHLEIRGTPTSSSSVDLNVHRLVPVRVPQMDALHSFSITPEGLSQLAVQFDTGSLVDNFPNLKTFTYEINRDANPGARDALAALSGEENGDGGVGHLRHYRVASLKFNVSGESLVSLAQLGQFYPLVTHADLVLKGDLSQFASIWTSWPVLKTLQLQCSTVSSRDVLEMDEFLSGVPKASFQELRDRLKIMVDEHLTTLEPLALDLEHLRDLWRQHKANPGLGDLKYLQKLIIRVRGGPYDKESVQRPYCNVSDIGGYFGLAMANPGLQSLTLQTPYHSHSSSQCPNLEAYHGNEISDECCSIIRSALWPYAVIVIW